MNKGLYGYPLPPNVATRVAPAEWRNQLLLSNAGSGNFTVPQNVFQVQVTAIGGGANGCHPYFEPQKSGQKFHFSAVQRQEGDPTSPHSSGLVSQLGSGRMALCDDGTQVYAMASGAIRRTEDVRRYSGASTVVTVAGAAVTYVYRSGSTILAVSSALSGGTARSTDGGLTFTTVSAANVPVSTMWQIGVASLSGSSFCGSNAGANIYYTTDTGTTFLNTTTTSALVTTVRGIAAGAGLYVVVGATTTTNGGIATSPTGATWTARTSNTGGTTQINNVRFLNNLFIAVGNSGYLATSSDGISWTARTTGTATALNDVSWDGTRYVAVGGSSTIIYSTNLSTWTAATKDATVPFAMTLQNILSPASGVFFTYRVNSSNTEFNGAASFDGGLNWYGTLWTQYTDTSPPTYTTAQIINEQILLFSTPNNDLYVAVPNGSFGGGGGGFASAIIDVMPGQSLPYVVGATGGTSSVGTAVSATGGDDRIGGTGVVASNLRGAAAYSGGNGGVISLQSPLTIGAVASRVLTVGGGGGGSCGWYGFNGGSSPVVTQVADGTSVTVSGGLGGAGLGGAAGGNTGAAGGVGGGGGGGGYRTSGADGTSSGGGGGGGSVTNAITTTGGNGFSCIGGGVGTPSGTSGGTPTTELVLNVFSSLRNGVVDGAGGGASGNSTAALQGGAGSGFGGGGGGTGSTSTSAGFSSGGSGSPGGGGGGGGAGGATSSGLFNRNGGDGGAFAGGGGAGGSATLATTSTAIYNAYAGNGGLGAGGGGVCINWNMAPTGVGTSPAIRLDNATQRIAGSKVAGAPGAGGNGVVLFEWTEGY